MTRNFDARAAAARILVQLEKREAYLDLLLDSAFGSLKAPQRDKAFCTALVYGVERQKLRLDRFIGAAAQRDIGGTHPKLLAILRLGAFQLLFMDRVPPSAAVDTSVKAAKASGQGHAAGFVNAVLRRIAEGVRKPEAADEADRISLAYSAPAWLVSHWIEREGLAGAEMLAAASVAEPPLFIRADTRLITLREARLGLGGEGAAGLGRYAPESLWVKGQGDPRALPLLQEKLAVVQGQASQLVAPLLGARPGMRVLDACAAPGMKTLHLARLMDDKGELVALELHPHRARALAETAAGFGFTSISVRTEDAARFKDGPFDAVLADVPCSGLGVLARNPERKWRLCGDDFERLGRAQLAILENLGALVRPGGILVYATCTTTAEENELVVGRFLAAHPEFEAVPADLPPELVDGHGYLRCYPLPRPADPGYHLDGFFAARLRRR